MEVGAEPNAAQFGQHALHSFDHFICEHIAIICDDSISSSFVVRAATP
jgi:hypothetical protein